jgi:hypothetical protein
MNKNLAKRMQWEASKRCLLRGWLRPPDGRTIPKSAYPELWSAIKAGAGYADPWLDLGGIEFDFTITPTTHLTVTDGASRFLTDIGQAQPREPR